MSDIHGNLPALEAVLADIRPRRPDAIVNLGDCVTSPLWPRETYQLLESLSLPTVRGNHDRWIGDGTGPLDSRTIAFARDALDESQRLALATLPPSLTIAGDVVAVHGTPSSDTEYLLEEARDGRLALVTRQELQARLTTVSASLVLCGHSHNQHLAEAADGRLVLNPGSVGCPRYADNDIPSAAEAGSPHARYALAARRGDRWSVEMIALAYEWSHVVDRAITNGRDDWAGGFLGGLRDGRG